MRFCSEVRTRGAVVLVLAATALAALPGFAQAQYFGRNKVQYDNFDFQVLKTDHFDFHFYPVAAVASEDAARMGERWYERFARAFQHEFEQSKPVILYADHPDFQQTNTLDGFISEGTGGVTESLKNRVIMPMTGSYWDTDHVLGHELVHAFQYNIAQSRRGGGLQGLMGLPLWLIEGMAEYLSIGREDPLTAMWIRDAIRRDELPTIEEMTKETRFFPYRFGQALWAFVGGTYGDDAVIQIFRRALRVGFEPAIQQVLGLSADTLSLRWKEKVAEEYLPLMAGRDIPSAAGDELLSPRTGAGQQNVSPSLSPDGRYVAFLSEKDLFSMDLYIADARTGEILRKLWSASSDPHIDALRYIDSSGTWSPDGRFFAFVVTAGGANRMIIVEAANGNEDRRVEFPDIGAVANPAWSPDGRYIAFSGSVGGISDIFLYDLEAEESIQLTDDKNADFHPAWSPDGRTIAFTSDRGPETDFQALTYSRFQIALLDVASRQVSPVSIFGNVKHINPQYAPGGESLYFISDQDGFSDVYQLDLSEGSTRRITNLATAVSGITYISPAMSVAPGNGRMVFTVFDSLEFHVYGLDPAPEAMATIAATPAERRGRMLPPANPDRFSRIATYLADPLTGLPAENRYVAEDAERYSSSLSLDYVGQPSLGVGADEYGNYLGGGAAAYFSDMLGDRVLGVSLQAQGTLKDIGGQAFYADLSRRWNWAVGGGRVPYILGYYQYGADAFGSFLAQTRFRIFNTSVQGQASYPFSSSQRFEMAAGLSRYSYDIEVLKYYDNGGFEQLDSIPPDPLTMYQGGAALVGDNTVFGFVSPIRGGRYRLGVEHTFGTADFTTLIGDWRRYYGPHRNLTVGLRGMHYGRYGLTGAENAADSSGIGFLNPLFLGYETFIRGYAYESFSNAECESIQQSPNPGVISSCPAFDRLRGQRIAVANMELRIPLIGVEQYGIINFPFLPTELVFFADGGLAWDEENRPTLRWSTDSAARVPVFSTGVSARFNVLGFMVLEAYYAKPFQRPQKDWHWGFQIAPGW